ncbi:zinc finger transcription factor Trps1 [Diretmus argenteus]
MVRKKNPPIRSVGGEEEEEEEGRRRGGGGGEEEEEGEEEGRVGAEAERIIRPSEPESSDRTRGEEEQEDEEDEDEGESECVSSSVSPSSVGARDDRYSNERGGRRGGARAKKGREALTDRPESQSEPEDGERGGEDTERGDADHLTPPLLPPPHLLLPRQEGGEESTTETPPLSSSPSPKLQDFKCNVCGYGYYGNDPADLVKHFRKYHLGLHNRTRQDAALDTHILALHNMAPQHTHLDIQAGQGQRNQAKESGKTRPDLHSQQHRTVMMNGTYDVQVTLGGTLIGIGRKTPDCQGNTKYFRCKFCNFTYMGSSSIELEQHFLSSHPNKVKTPPTTPLLASNNLATHDNQAKGRSQVLDGAERVAVRAEDDSLVGYSIPVRGCSDSPSWSGEAGRGSVLAYYWCKFCSWSCEWAGGSGKLLEHYEQRHRGDAMSPNNSNPGGMERERERGGRREGGERDAASKSRKDPANASSTNQGDPNSSDSEAVVTSYNCQLCDFRYSMAHSADVIVVAPLLLHYQHNHSIHRCCIQHCIYCPQGLCQPHKHLGEVSHPFACRKASCPKCCSKFPQSTKQQEAVGSKPAIATSPSMTPPTPRGDPGAMAGSTFHLSNPVHPVVTQGVTHLCDQCAFATADIDVLLQHYESCHSLISLKGAPPHVKAEEEVGGEKEGGGGGEREYSCTKCHFITEVEEEIFRHYSFSCGATPRPLNIIKQNNGEQIIRRRTRKRLNPDSLSAENPAPKQQRITSEEHINGEEPDRGCQPIKNQQPSPRSRSPRSTQAFLANQTLEIHRRMPPLLLPSHPPSSLVTEGNGGILEGGITAKVEGGKGGGSERGSPIEKYMRPSKPSSYSPPGSPIEKYQYPLFSLPLPLTLPPDLSSESDWLRFWTKYKMAATSGVPGAISNLSSPGGLGTNAHYLGAMVTPIQHHQQSYTVPYCVSPYSPLPPPPAPPHYPPPPLHPQTPSSSSSSLENDAPLDLAIRQRDTHANANMSTNGAERRRQESPLAERKRENWKGEKEEEERMDEGGKQTEEIEKEEKDHHQISQSLARVATVEVATQDDLTNRCIHCGIYFLDEVMYALHMSCHGDGGPYQCSFCLHVCLDRYDFTTHIQRGLHRYTENTPTQSGHIQEGKGQKVTVMSEGKGQNEVMSEENDGGDDGDHGDDVGESDDVTGVCHDDKVKEVTGDDAEDADDDNATGVEGDSRGEVRDITNQESGVEIVTDCMDDISKGAEVTAVAESKLDESSVSN